MSPEQRQFCGGAQKLSLVDCISFQIMRQGCGLLFASIAISASKDSILVARALGWRGSHLRISYLTRNVIIVSTGIECPSSSRRRAAVPARPAQRQ